MTTEALKHLANGKTGTPNDDVSVKVKKAIQWRTYAWLDVVPNGRKGHS